MEEDAEYRLDEVNEEEINMPPKGSPKRNKLIISLVIIIIFLVLAIIAGILVYFLILKKDDKDGGKEKEDTQEIFFIYPEIQTSENNKIKNTFGKDGIHYIKEIGNINNGKDYEANDRDNFDLCIPENVMKNKTNYTTILLDIHGGAWIAGNKNDASTLCKNDLTKNFIVATMSHTLLNGQYKEYNLFRIIDEIDAALKTLKNFLIKKGFEENKLEVIMKGGSSGAHLCLLYSYMIKNPPIPIKFIINNVGPVTLDPQYFLQTKPNDPPLENIDPESIDKAINQNLLIPMNGSATGVDVNNTILIICMNVWLGKYLSDSFDEIFINQKTGELNKSNEKYIDLINKAKFGNPTTYVEKDSVPTICLYGGKDSMDGVMQYYLLKKKFDEKKNDKIALVYFKKGTHNVFANAEGEYGKIMMQKYNEIIHSFYRKYLDSYNKNK